MQPCETLKVEHQLITRMLALMKREIEQIQAAAELDPAFIETAVDFMRVYADRTHHGKEEEILFHELTAKPMAPDHVAAMRDLINDHRYARELTDNLVNAHSAHARGDKDALGWVISSLISLTDFYPRHIVKEHTAFYPAAMTYLDAREQAAMLERFREFDRSMIHEKYETVLQRLGAHGRAGSGAAPA